MVGKRNSMGMIKIGEKPPPGLFPETLPYSISPGGSSALPGSSSSASSSDSSSQADLLNAISGSGNGQHSNPLSTSELFSKLVAAAAANGQLSSDGSSDDSNSELESAGGSTSQLIPHFSTSDLKTSSSDIRPHNLLQPSKMISNSFFPRRFLLPLSSSSSYTSNLHSNMFNANPSNNGNTDQQSFEGTFEVLQN